MGRFDGAVDLAQIAATGNPDAGRNKLYFKSDEKLYTRNPSGVETLIGPGAATAIIGSFQAASNQSIPHNTFTTITLGTALLTNLTYFTAASSIITVLTAGTYRITAPFLWDTNAGTVRKIFFCESFTGSDPGVGNGTQRARMEATSTSYLGGCLSDVIILAANEKVRLVGFQLTGVALSLLPFPPAKLVIEKL